LNLSVLSREFLLTPGALEQSIRSMRGR